MRHQLHSMLTALWMFTDAQRGTRLQIDECCSQFAISHQLHQLVGRTGPRNNGHGIGSASPTFHEDKNLLARDVGINIQVHTSQPCHADAKHLLWTQPGVEYGTGREMVSQGAAERNHIEGSSGRIFTAHALYSGCFEIGS